MMSNLSSLPVAVIGGGPVGLAAAAHLLENRFQPVVLEAGPQVGSSIRQWSHVRTFSPWKYMIDEASRRLLHAKGWTAPNADILPTGGQLVSEYLEPLAAMAPLRDSIRLNSRVVAISRQGVDKVKSAGRENSPFLIRYEDEDGLVHEFLAQAVIDASGTWTQPNPLGAPGLPAIGESTSREHLFYGIPDVLGIHRGRYEARRVLVVGSGHSATNTLLDLAKLAGSDAATRIFWGIRRDSPGTIYGGGSADALPARGVLGVRLRSQVDSGLVTLLSGFRIGELRVQGDSVEIFDTQGKHVITVDQVVVATGARPDLEMVRELRLDLDPTLECPRQLGPLIDPNVHSCGSVRPHGAFELLHPEPNFFIVGMKSYGRAPTFLLATGYEQVRSVVAYLVGNMDAARAVQLSLPETGVCSTDLSEFEETLAPGTEGCCGGPARQEGEACCAADADAKAAGEPGCGCSSSAPRPEGSENDSTSQNLPIAGTNRNTCCS